MSEQLPTVVGLGSGMSKLDELLISMKKDAGPSYVSDSFGSVVNPSEGEADVEKSRRRRGGRSEASGDAVGVATAKAKNNISLRSQDAVEAPIAGDPSTVFTKHDATKRPRDEEICPPPMPSVVAHRFPSRPANADNAFEATPVDESSVPDTATPDALRLLLHPKLHRPTLDKMKIERLTRVQTLSWGPMCNPGQDVMIRSETGSGKTLAYALPLMHSLLTNNENLGRESGTKIIIMAPTRELTEQVSGVIQVLATFAPFVVVGAIHGGDNRHKEKARLRKGVTILVATPGRLLDHLKTTESFSHSGLESVVLDEADRLLDMGFEKAIREIMGLILPKKRVLVSATITDSVQRLAHFALERPIKVGETEDTFNVPQTLRQYYTVTQPKQRLALLLAFLKMQLDAGSRKIVVFVSTSDSAEFHYLLLSRFKNPYRGAGVVKSRKEWAAENNTRRGHKANKKLIERANSGVGGDEDHDDQQDTGVLGGRQQGDFVETLDDGTNAFINVNTFKLHGNMTQVDRASVFHSFKTQPEQGVLFCTDVAARGLDMPHIDWIVHYDPPTDERCYVHRVGRTARLGKVGDSILFFQESEQPFVEYLSSFVRMPIQLKKADLFMFYLTKLDPKCDHFWVVAVATLMRGVFYCIRNDTALARVSLFAYQSFLRAYNGFPRAVKQYFNPQLLHLGHVAASFGIDATPSEVRKRLNAEKLSKEERDIGRDRTRFEKHEKMEVDTKETYHSTLVSKHVKATKEYHIEQKEKARNMPKPFQFSEFDA